MLAEVKRCVDNNDIEGLHYIFVDSLDVDPTFEKYKDDYEYCKSIDGFLVAHTDITPMLSSEKWDKGYWEQLKIDLLKNFSDVRFSHMREVAQIVYADKVRRLKQEREKDNNQPISTGNNTQQRPIVETSRGASYILEEDRNALLEKQKKIERENERIEKELSAQKARIKAANSVDKAQSFDNSKSPKKSMGVAAIMVIIAIIIVVVILLIVL